MGKNVSMLEEILGEDINMIVFKDFDYDSALIGYSEDYRAIYDYDLMIEYLMNEQGMSDIDAIEWIEYNTLRALPYYGQEAPIIMHRLY